MVPKAPHFYISPPPQKSTMIPRCASPNRLQVVGAVLCCAVLVSGCRSEPDIPIDRYHHLLHPLLEEVAEEEVEVYIDFSTGMGEGMRASATVNQSLFNFLQGRRVNFFRVGGREDVPIPLNLGDREANFLDMNNFSEVGSNLAPILRRATSNNTRTAVFITDFEHILPFSSSSPGSPRPHPIDVSAWGQIYFREWLTAGHRLDIFAFRYEKPDGWFGRTQSSTFVNWIYTLVLTPRGVVQNPDLYAASVVKYMKELHAGHGTDEFKHFAYTTDLFRLEHRDDPANGNVNEEVVVTDWWRDNISPIPFEVYRFASRDLVSFQRDQGRTDDRLFSGLRLWSEPGLMTEVEFGIRVTDVTSPLRLLANFLDAPPPEDEEQTNDAQSDSLGATAAPPEVSSGVRADGVFQFVHDHAQRTAGIKLHPDFTGVRETTIYRIDLVIESAQPAPLGEAADVYSLNYAGGFRVNALAESIRLALRDVTSSRMGSSVHAVYVIVEP